MVTNLKAGGFRVPLRTARLVFTDLYEGAEVVVRLSVPLGVAVSMAERENNEDPRPVYTSFVQFGLDNWNLEDDTGSPVPMTVEGLESLPADLVMLMIDQWVRQIGNVPAPLAQPSSNGSMSPEASIPMGT